MADETTPEGQLPAQPASDTVAEGVQPVATGGEVTDELSAKTAAEVAGEVSARLNDLGTGEQGGQPAVTEHDEVPVPGMPSSPDTYRVKYPGTGEPSSPQQQAGADTIKQAGADLLGGAPQPAAPDVSTSNSGGGTSGGTNEGGGGAPTGGQI